jgi:integrase/recombinase XerD
VHLFFALYAKKGVDAMPRPPKPIVIAKRNDSKTFQFTLNFTCGLHERVCAEWRRRSFQDLPAELVQFRNPKTKADAAAGAFAFVSYLKKKQEEGSARRVVIENITAGEWIEKFTSLETSPRTGINASENRPYSVDSVENYLSYYILHIKGDPLTELKMPEVEEEDVLDFTTRLSVKKLKDDRPMAGTRTFVGTIVFLRMTFRAYQSKNKRWINPFQHIRAPKYNSLPRDSLQEDEAVKLFMPGILKDTIELAVCAAMFLSGLRRSEIYALKPDCLDWHTPKITIKNSWQRFNKKDRVLRPTKSKKERDVPFDSILQDAIKNPWEENGQYEFVFCLIDGRSIGPSWIKKRFPKWLERAGIKLNGRKIVPHSSRHSSASLLEERGVSLRYIQDLLGHSDLKTTKIYLHSTEKTIRDIGMKIAEAREKAYPEQKEEQNNIVNFRVS